MQWSAKPDVLLFEFWFFHASLKYLSIRHTTSPKCFRGTGQSHQFKKGSLTARVCYYQAACLQYKNFVFKLYKINTSLFKSQKTFQPKALKTCARRVQCSNYVNLYANNVSWLLLLLLLHQPLFTFVDRVDYGVDGSCDFTTCPAVCFSLGEPIVYGSPCGYAWNAIGNLPRQ